MKTILILALICATFAPAAEPVTVIFDGKPQQVLIVENQPDGILVATSKGERKLKTGDYILTQALPAPRTPTPRVPAPRQPVPRVPAPRTPAPRVPAPRIHEDVAGIRDELAEIRKWMILEEARKRGINIAIYR